MVALTTEGAPDSLSKAAILLIALGPELSALVLKHLPEPQVERLTGVIMAMPAVPAALREAVLEEFSEAALAREYMTTGGPAYARQMLERALGKEKAEAVVEKLLEAQRPASFSFLDQVEPASLATFLGSEHPQLIALVLSRAGVHKTAAVLPHLSPALQTEVAIRIATMERGSDILVELEQLVEQKLSPLFKTATEAPPSAEGGIDHLVNVLKQTDRSTEQTIINLLDEREPQLAEEIRKRMFVFENIAGLDDRSLQRILREVDFKDLALALRGAGEEIRQRIFSNMSERARAMLQEDMDIQGPVRLRAVQEAQSRIVAAVRRLEAAEEIVIARGGSDEILL